MPVSQSETQTDILFSKQNNIAVITLNKPKIKNAFDASMIAKITEYLIQIQNDISIRIAILKSTGEYFSSGADLNWMRSMVNFTEKENFEDALKLANMLRLLFNLNKPTICMIQGPAFGGAVGLVACCDIAIASTNAVFCFSEVKLGLAPATISPFIINAIGFKNATRWMLTADKFTAKQALQMQLLQEIVEQKDLEKMQNKISKQLLQAGPKALETTKNLIHTISKQQIHQQELDNQTAAIIAKLRRSKEGQQGINCFLNKTPPEWYQNGDRTIF